MAYILKNKNLKIYIDSSNENYQFSRFDWTGKITKLQFQGVDLLGIENNDCKNDLILGKGLYNEFGIESALGFYETAKGDWFHKIGIGLLKKEDDEYLFNKNYKIKPASFNITTKPNKLIIKCTSEKNNGYSYLFKKKIELFDNSFIINYYLLNTGEKDIITNEYVHNFISINKDLIGENYKLKFPFDLKPNLFNETVNPEQKVDLGINSIMFNGTPKEQFFFSKLNGGKIVNAAWEITNLKNNVGIRETGSFNTNKVNLWGWEHVVSPELFYSIDIKPGEAAEWCRTYNLFKIK